MARVYHMSWVPSRRGWMKEYRGKKYAVSCRQLGTPENKESSYQAANAWWASKKCEIDAASRPTPRTPDPLEDLAAAILGKQGPLNNFDAACLAFAQAWKKRREVEEYLEVQMKYEEEGPPDWEERPAGDPDEARRRTIWAAVSEPLRKLIMEGQALPEEVRALLSPARGQQVEGGVKGLRGEASAPAARTVAAHADAWLKHQQAKVEAGTLKAARYRNDRVCLAHFRTYLGESADVSTIDDARLYDFYLHCRGKMHARRKDPAAGWSSAYARDVFSVGKAWVHWLWERDAIELPKNFRRPFKFGSPAKAVKTWSMEEYKSVVAAASGKLKLALLLMANCGMTQVDVSELKAEEVSLVEGRIIRKRRKTEDHENVPVVNYVLWPSTLALLREHHSGTERVLLTETGIAFVRKELVKGKPGTTDSFASRFKRLQRRLKFYKPMKLIRKTAATLLEKEKEHRPFSTLFLGHSPKSIKERHYIDPSAAQDQFDQAVLWLGVQLGQVPPPA
jgi:integrase